jgi:hypothetical protein
MKKRTFLTLTLTAVGAALLTYLVLRNRTKIIQEVSPKVMDKLTSGKDIATLTLELAEAGDKLRASLDARADNEHNRRILSHMIGIERWGRRRLLVALGEPLFMDEYDGYRPRRETSWEELKEMFTASRRDTVNVAHQLANVDPNLRLPHNQFGEFTLADWLFYLRIHADAETQKMR